MADAVDDKAAGLLACRDIVFHKDAAAGDGLRVERAVVHNVAAVERTEHKVAALVIEKQRGALGQFELREMERHKRRILRLYGHQVVRPFGILDGFGFAHNVEARILHNADTHRTGTLYGVQVFVQKTLVVNAGMVQFGNTGLDLAAVEHRLAAVAHLRNGIVCKKHCHRYKC